MLNGYQFVEECLNSIHEPMGYFLFLSIHFDPLHFFPHPDQVELFIVERIESKGLVAQEVLIDQIVGRRGWNFI